MRLSNPERTTLAEIGKRLGRKALREVACVAKPDTVLAWYRKLIAQKFDGSKNRQYPGRPPVSVPLDDFNLRANGHKLLFEDCDWLITPRERTGLVGGTTLPRVVA